MRLRERRIELGLTQQKMAELIGVIYQQAHKYKKVINQLSSGRLYAAARVLGVEISSFFEDLEVGGGGFRPTAEQRLLLELIRNFSSISDQRQQEALCN
jgi:transcriptional regulator with XRE-family HTH domain